MGGVFRRFVESSALSIGPIRASERVLASTGYKRKVDHDSQGVEFLCGACSGDAQGFSRCRFRQVEARRRKGDGWELKAREGRLR